MRYILIKLINLSTVQRACFVVYSRDYREIRAVTLDAMPDTGAWTMVINEDIRQKPGLVIAEISESTLTDNSLFIFYLL